MSIGSTIKKLRRERDMTQEQLADLLSITANAVSQWECDRTAPDISQLPALANIFRVSADVLLGIDVASKDARIDEIYQNIRELWCTGQRSEAEALCREGLTQFPDAEILTEELAFYLSCSKNPATLEESIALFERIRANTDDECTKNFAIGNLCDLYMKIGNEETAKQLVEGMPTPIYTQKDLRLMTLRGENWAYELRAQVWVEFNSFIWKLRNLANAFNEKHPLFTEEERLVLWQKAIDMTLLFYEDGDYDFDGQILIDAHFKKARILVTLGDSESALNELEQMLLYINSFDMFSSGLLGNHVEIPPEKWPTSLLTRPRDENDPTLVRTVSNASTENAAMEYLKKLSDIKFDTIRNHPRFIAVAEELKKTSHGF